MKRWYWGHRGMEPWEFGHYVLRQDVIDALAQLPRSEWPSDEVLGALGLEWHDLAAVDGGREDT